MSDSPYVRLDDPIHVLSRPSMAPPRPKKTKEVRKRASRACSFCQWRKIRCNVLERNPCSNCTIEQIPCSVGKPRKKRTTNTEANQQKTTSPSPPSLVAESIAPTGDNDVLSFPNLQSSPDLRAQANNDPNASHRVDDQEDSVQSNGPPLTQAAPLHGIGDYSSQPASYWDPLPSYVKGPPARLSSEDLAYLSMKGSFTIPTTEFRDALVRAYADFIHPYMPLLDLNEFVLNINDISGVQNSISLLVLQAVMFAGSAHVDIKPLRSMGFLTRKAARRALFQRAKILYDLEYEEHRISVIQALLLMSLWYESPDDQKDAYHWLNIALSLARRAGLNRDTASKLISEHDRRFRRRLWWCCVIRDSLVALGLKRPVSISAGDYDVPELCLEDCDTKEESYEALKAIGLPWNEEKFHLLGQLYLAEMRLHRCLSQILENQYSLREHNQNRSDADGKTSTAILLPVMTEMAQRTISDCETSLQLWYDTLPTELMSLKSAENDSNSIFTPVKVFRTVLLMTYHTCIITLYRPWLTVTKNGYTAHSSVSNRELKDKVETAVQRSAQSITDLAVYLHISDLTRHLPQTGLSALVAAVVIHIGNAASTVPDLQASGLRGFEQCFHMLNELRENYYSADFSTEFVNLMARAMKIAHVSSFAVPDVDPATVMFDLSKHSNSLGAVPTHNTIAATLYPPTPELGLCSPMDANNSFNQPTAASVDEDFSFDLASSVGDSTILNHYQHFHKEISRLLGDAFNTPDLSVQALVNMD